MTQVLLDVLARPDKPQKSARLVMTDQAMVFTDRTIAWPNIDKVDYSAIDHYTNGAYQHTTFSITVGTPDRQKAGFQMISGTTGFLRGRIDHEKRDRNRELWSQAVDILLERVATRIVSQAISAVEHGGATELGGVRIDRQGLHKGTLFKKSIEWDQVAGTEIKYGYHRIMAYHGEKTKPRIQVPRGTWNAVLLPAVIRVFAPRARPTQ
ncbi:hypothetical protein [Actinocrispum sp. NPDC049592]|uniref:hypothetical protein n=1 Tax=Actinocrispum sp. NPDC049592 TaxID=3154835 RepID=UPI003413FD18